MRRINRIEEMDCNKTGVVSLYNYAKFALIKELWPEVSYEGYRQAFRFPKQVELFEMADQSGLRERIIAVGLPPD